jgi:FtsP/CotA-like multicopper oxidase with cupredoxin domain
LLTLQNELHQFYPNVKSSTKGFNGNYLGPIFRLYKNDSPRIRLTNKINEVTTVHVHAGLADMYIIEDDNPLQLPLPNTIVFDPFIFLTPSFLSSYIQLPNEVRYP